MEHIRRLGDIGITCHTQLVILPTINDGAELERSMRELTALKPIVESISVVPVGLTKYNNMIKTGELPPLRHFTQPEAEAIITQVEAYQREFSDNDPEGYPFVFLSDEWYFLTHRDFPLAEHYGTYAQIENGVGMTRFLIDQWSHTKRRLPPRLPAAKRVTLVTGIMAQPVIEGLAADMRTIEGLQVQVKPIINKFFGSEVTVAGLLCGQDVLDELHELQTTSTPSDLILLPRVMLNNDGLCFLDDITVEEFKAQLAPARVEFVRNAQETVDVMRSLAGMAGGGQRRLVRVQSRL
jgi:putative radical SAM enzyme (TIGR03279 family)